MSAIEWTEHTWNPVTGCDRVSPGCDSCYALKMAGRLKLMGQAKYQNDGDPRTSGPGFRLTLHPDVLDVPLRRQKPTTWFVNSMSDLFHKDVPDEFIVDVLAVMALTPQHTYQVLTKRPQRMAPFMADPKLPGRVARAADRITVQHEIERMGPERRAEIDGFPGYQVTDRGRVLLEGGSEVCVWCDEPIPVERSARARYCSQTCNSKVNYERSQGRWEDPVTFREIRPDTGEQGHQRIAMVGRDGTQQRCLVHRLVLAAFRRPAEEGEQGCHRDGDPTNNALPNLRWGMQADNWADRIRHGNGQSYARLTLQDVEQIREGHRAGCTASWLAERFGVSDTQVRNVVRGDQWAEASEWPIPGLWLGTSIESDRYTFRADHLRNTPAAIRFLSLEPLLGPLPSLDLTGIDWVIVGGESGPGARPMHPDWVVDVLDRCEAAGVPFFFKQWGAWSPIQWADARVADTVIYPDGTTTEVVSASNRPGGVPVRRVGKQAAGRLLGGRTWDQMPERKAVAS